VAFRFAEGMKSYNWIPAKAGIQEKTVNDPGESRELPKEKLWEKEKLQ
jgi:hypothetical protein